MGHSLWWGHLCFLHCQITADALPIWLPFSSSPNCCWYLSFADRWNWLVGQIWPVNCRLPTPDLKWFWNLCPKSFFFFLQSFQTKNILVADSFMFFPVISSHFSPTSATVIMISNELLNYILYWSNTHNNKISYPARHGTLSTRCWVPSTLKKEKRRSSAFDTFSSRK